MGAWYGGGRSGAARVITAASETRSESAAALAESGAVRGPVTPALSLISVATGPSGERVELEASVRVLRIFV